MSTRKKVLIVNCYIDENRRLAGRPSFIPQAVGPVYLAGAFARERWDIRLYSELYSGPLEDEALFAWPDLLVLTGMTSAFDRMLHITAYTRSRNERVVVVAGGAAIRALPRYSARFFDFVCTGDVEQLQEVVRQLYGDDHVSEEMVPRYDLMNWLGLIGHVESSRNCNFRCSFCTLTGEGNSYWKYDLDHVRKQILAIGRRKNILFIDNNFYGNDRDFFLARLELLKELRQQGCFDGWSALVTSDFFLNRDNLRLAYESGCRGLFSGIESFDSTAIRGMNKMQNLRLPQVEMISSCMDAGIAFFYGVIFDTGSRTLEEIRGEIELITGTPEITLPSFMNLTIPILGTPYFHECMSKRLILPLTKLRDLDGNTIAVQPLDPIEDVVQFLIDLPNLRGYRDRVLKHCLGFVRRYGRRLDVWQMGAALLNALLLCTPAFAHNPFKLRKREQASQRTYVATTEPAGPLYEPRFYVAPRYRSYFTPTMVTDARGELAPELHEDLSVSRRRIRLPRVEV